MQCARGWVAACNDRQFAPVAWANAFKHASVRARVSATNCVGNKIGTGNFDRAHPTLSFTGIDASYVVGGRYARVNTVCKCCANPDSLLAFSAKSVNPQPRNGAHVLSYHLAPHIFRAKNVKCVYSRAESTQRTFGHGYRQFRTGTTQARRSSGSLFATTHFDVIGFHHHTTSASDNTSTTVDGQLWGKGAPKQAL
jgi:hypothetical protein